MNDNRIITALDVNTMEQVKNLVDSIGEAISYYKVGMELFYNLGPEVIEYLKAKDKNVFLDLKLHDIPNTVMHGTKALAKLGADMISIHASGGPEMIKAARRGVEEAKAEFGVKGPKIVAITILTSMNEREWQAIGGVGEIKDQVVRLAKLAKDSGADGVVASPQEIVAIREACGEEFLVVTPGIRPLNSSANDQSRIATPGQAIKDGASHLVIGRPIHKAENPREAAINIIKEMRNLA